MLAPAIEMIADPDRLGALVGAEWTADRPRAPAGIHPARSSPYTRVRVSEADDEPQSLQAPAVRLSYRPARRAVPTCLVSPTRSSSSHRALWIATINGYALIRINPRTLRRTLLVHITW